MKDFFLYRAKNFLITFYFQNWLFFELFKLRKQTFFILHRENFSHFSIQFLKLDIIIFIRYIKQSLSLFYILKILILKNIIIFTFVAQTFQIIQSQWEICNFIFFFLNWRLLKQLLLDWLLLIYTQAFIWIFLI